MSGGEKGFWAMAPMPVISFLIRIEYRKIKNG
jgi:hypothetical protein